jgi:hypothetical protein
MYIERHSVAITTAADGSATAYSPVVTGRVLAIRYVKDTFDNGIDFTVTVENTGEAIWAQSDVNASATVYPRVGVHDAVGVAATTDGTRLLRDYVHVSQDRIKIVVAQGGNVKAGTVIVIVG